MTQTGEEDDLPIPPKKGYNLDFLDDPNFDPFNTGSSIRLSPPGSPKAKLPPLSLAKKKKQREASAEAAVEKPADKEPETKDEAVVSNGVSKEAGVASSAPPAKKPAPKKVARPVKRPLKKPPPARTEPDNDAAAGIPEARSDSPPLAKPGAYNLDFLDNCDDPNINPFATKSAVCNSPTGSPKLSRRPVAASPPLPATGENDNEKEQESPPPSVKPTARKPIQKQAPKSQTPPRPTVEPVEDGGQLSQSGDLSAAAVAGAELSVMSAVTADDTDAAAGEALAGPAMVKVEMLEDPLGGGDSVLVHADDSAKAPSAISLLDTAPLEELTGTAAAAAAPERAGAENFVEASEFFQNSSELDKLAEHCHGRLASNIARNSLFVKFDPLLGRPSVLPELQRLAGAQPEQEPAVARQPSSVKQNLIAFSPGKDADQEDPVTSAPLAAAADNSAAAAPPEATTQDDELKQKLSLQHQLLTRDMAITTMKNKLTELEKQLAKCKQSLEVEQAALSYLASSKERQCCLLTEGMRELKSERDEAREEVANIEAMFADLHRKYEKSKLVVADHRQRGEQLSATLRDREEQLSRETARYDLLQKHAEDAMERLRADQEVLAKGLETENLRLTMKLKLSDNRVSKLEDDNRQLTAMCDELIQKMGDPR